MAIPREVLERSVALFAEAEQVAGMGWWSWDVNSNEVFWSDNCYRLLGLEPGSVTPSPEQLFSAVHPEDLQRVMDSVARAAKTQSTPPMEYRLLGADGQVRYVRAHGTAVLDAQGAPLYQVGTLQDRTETVQREQASERNRVLLSETQFAGAVSAFEWWPESGLIHGLPQFYRFLGLPMDQPVGVDTLQALVHPEDLVHLPLLADLNSPLGEARRCRVRLVLDEGPVHVLVVSSLQQLAGGARFVTGGLVDVSEQALLEEKLRSAQRLETLGRLSAGISHDFNNLLTIILANAMLLNELNPSPELDSIIQAGEKGSDLTRRLLAIGRKAPPQVGPMDMDTAVFKSVRLLKGVLGSGVRLHTTLSAHAQAICEPQQLQQVVFNLVINAFDALEGNGEIRVETSLCSLGDQPGVEVRVVDNGPGIPPEVLARVFEPFFTTKGADKGSGLGLPMVREIVEGLGGSIEIDSTLGRGTTVRLCFRQVVGRRTQEEERTAWVLVVEDDAQVRRLVRQILERAGYRVTEADSPSHARQAIAGNVPDLVISDISMPEGGGRAVLSHFRREHPGVPVLMVSGYDAGQIGLDAPVLFKPFSPKKLRQAVARALGQEE